MGASIALFKNYELNGSKVNQTAVNCNIFFFRVTYRDDGIGVVSQQLYSVLTRLQMGLIEDKKDWTVELR